MKKKFLFIFIMLLFNINVWALKSDSSELINRNVCPNYELALANSDDSITSISCYDTYDLAKVAMDENTDPSVIILERINDKVEVVDAKYALVYLDMGIKDKLTYVYNNASFSSQLTYMYNSSSYGGTDGALLEINYSNKAAKIKISGVTGWIKNDTYKVIPINWVKSNSYYSVTNSDIIHYYAKNIENSGYTLSSRKLGPKPSMIDVGKYYSYDGNYFYSDLVKMLDDYKNGDFNNSVNNDSVYYNYYMYLPHRSKTNYTIDDLDSYIRNVLGFNGSVYGKTLTNKKSVLYGTSEYYMNAEKLYGANAISVFGLSRNESANGTSKIAIDKNNVFGHNAVDGMAYNSATGYLDVRSSIYSHSYSYINYGYSEVADYRYHGGHFGNKDSGMNVSYASDVYWGEKAANYYYNFDKDNGMLDYDYYQLVVSKGSKINARSAPNTSSSVPFVIPTIGLPFILVAEVEGQVVNGSNIWYKLQADSNITTSGSLIPSNSSTMPNYNWNGYVYVHSSYFEKINDAKNSDGTYNYPSQVEKDTINKFSYTTHATKTTYTPLVGLLKEDVNYYYSSSLLNKKGTLEKGSYVTILETATGSDTKNYLVITDYGTYQKHWISGDNVQIIEKDLLKVNISLSGQYISIYNKPDGKEVFNVYTDNQLVIVDKMEVNNKLYLKVQYKNEDGILYGYVDSTIENISYTIDHIDLAPVIEAEDLIIMINQEYDLMEGVIGTDTEDGDITKNIKVIENNINAEKEGTYTVTYSLTDSYGNTTTKKINVYVVEYEEKDSLFMYHNLKHKEDDIFNISGFLGVKGMDNKEVIHTLVFEHQLTKEQYYVVLDNWKDYPYDMSSLDDDKEYDYSGGWFNSDIDLSDLPSGDYTVYVGAINGKNVTEALFTNIAYMDMTRRAVGKKHSYSIEVDYSTLNSPLVFSVRDELLSTTVPQTFDPMYNFFNTISLSDDKLSIKGTSHNVGVGFGKNDDIKRMIVFENKETFERYSYELGSITNGDYPITLAVSDNLDKTRAWFNKTVDLTSLPKGGYVIYIVNTVNGKSYHGELIDVAYTDFSAINNSKYELSRNDNIRLRLELLKKE